MRNKSGNSYSDQLNSVNFTIMIKTIIVDDEEKSRITLNNQTYTAQGWTIVVAPGGTTFTNGSSGHGMSVSDQGVKPF